MWRGLIKEYREFFSIDKEYYIVTLNEGNTPLIASRYIGGNLNPSIKL